MRFLVQRRDKRVTLAESLATDLRVTSFAVRMHRFRLYLLRLRLSAGIEWACCFHLLKCSFTSRVF